MIRQSTTESLIDRTVHQNEISHPDYRDALYLWSLSLVQGNRKLQPGKCWSRERGVITGSQICSIKRIVQYFVKKKPLLIGKVKKKQKNLTLPVQPIPFQRHTAPDATCRWCHIYRALEPAANHWPQQCQSVWEACYRDWLQGQVTGGAAGTEWASQESYVFSIPCTMFLFPGQLQLDKGPWWSTML